MGNENKTPATTGNPEQKKHNHKRKYHKPKSYFMTPAENGQNATSNDNAQKKPIPAESKPALTEAKNSGSVSAPANKPNNMQAGGQNRSKKKKKNRNNSNEGAKERAQTQMQQTAKPEALDAPKGSHNNANDRVKSDKLERPAPKRPERFSDSLEHDNKYADYEEFTYAELYSDDAILSRQSAQPSSGGEANEGSQNASDPQSQAVNSSTNDPLVDVVGIKFKDTGKTYYFDPNGVSLKVGQHAIVKTARGLEYGDVALSNTQVRESETVPPLRPVVRVANEADIKHHAENKEKEDSAFRICNEKIIAHKLDMKLIDAQYTFDNSKLLFYFTSSGRVDFRDLVKDLASVFKTRIELRQVGIRDEAKMVGGFGPCGRALCCTLFLTDFGQVSIKMAKEQSLSLNAAKISGICGRLMCCLRYEYETYDYEIKRTPPVDTVVKTVDGIGIVTEISPLTGTIKVRLNASPDNPPKSYKREDVSILKKKHNHSNE